MPATDADKRRGRRKEGERREWERLRDGRRGRVGWWRGGEEGEEVVVGEGREEGEEVVVEREGKRERRW